MRSFTIRSLLAVTALATALFAWRLYTEPRRRYLRSHDGRSFDMVMHEHFPNGSLKSDVIEMLGEPNRPPNPVMVEQIKRTSGPGSVLSDGYEPGDEFVGYAWVSEGDEEATTTLQFRDGKLVNRKFHIWNPDVEADDTLE